MKKPNLAIELSSYAEQQNMWIGPRQVGVLCFAMNLMIAVTDFSVQSVSQSVIQFLKQPEQQRY